MNNISFCDSSSILSVFWIFKTFVSFMKIAVPIILIIMCMIDVVKLVASSEVDTKKAFAMSKNRLIAAAVVFLVPSIINMVIVNISEVRDYTLTNCYRKATIENIELTQIAEKAKREYEANELKKEKGIITIPNLTAPVDTAKLSEGGGGGTNLVKFLMGWEGHEGYCDSSKSTYKAKSLGDGTITAGYGVTNYNSDWAKKNGYGQYFPMISGGCYSVKDFDDIFVKVIESHRNNVIKQAKKKGINLTGYQIDALTSYEYNYGGSVTPTILSRYVLDGNAGVLAYMKSRLKPEKWPGWNPRRDAEYTLFVEGVYSTTYYGRRCKYITGGSCKK